MQHALDRDVSGERRQRRIDRIDQQPEMHKRVPGCRDCGDQHDHTRDQRKPRPDQRHQSGDRQPEQHRQHDLKTIGPIRPIDKILRQNLLEQLRQDRHTGHGFTKRRGAGIEQPGGRGADQHDRSFDALAHRAVLGGVEQILDREVALRPVAIEINPGLAIIGERQPEGANAHVEQRRVAGVGLTAGAGAAHHHALLALRDPQRLDREVRIDLLAVRQQHRHAADHAAAVARTEIDGTDTGSGLIEQWQTDDRAVKGPQHLARLNADKGQPGLHWRPQLVAEPAGGKAEHGRGLADRLGEQFIVVR